MSLCAFNIVTRMGPKLFQLGYVEFNLKIKKNKPKKISYVKYFPGREIKSKKQANLLLGNQAINYVTFQRLFQMYGFKPAPISILVKLRHTINSATGSLWVNSNNSRICGRGKINSKKT